FRSRVCTGGSSFRKMSHASPSCAASSATCATGPDSRSSYRMTSGRSSTVASPRGRVARKTPAQASVRTRLLVEPERGVAVGECLFGVALGSEGGGEVGVGIGVVGVDPQGLPILGNGLLGASLLEEEIPKVVVGGGGLRLQLQSAEEVGRGLVE